MGYGFMIPIIYTQLFLVTMPLLILTNNNQSRMLSVKHGYGPFHSTAFPDDISVNRTITKALVRTTEWFCIQYASTL